MKQRIRRIITFLYIITMLVCATACGIQEIPQAPTEVVTNVEKEQIDLLNTVWIKSAREPEKTDSWSVVKYTEDFVPQMTEGELGTLLCTVDHNLFWFFSEIWETGDDGNKSREYQLTKYDMNLAQSCIPSKDEYREIELIIMEEVPAFFSGQKTAEQMAAIIQSRVTIFLEE